MQVVVDVMGACPELEEVQLTGIAILLNVTSEPRLRQSVVEVGGVRAIVDAVIAHPMHVEMGAGGLQVLHNLRAFGADVLRNVTKSFLSLMAEFVLEQMSDLEVQRHGLSLFSAVLQQVRLSALCAIK